VADRDRGSAGSAPAADAVVLRCEVGVVGAGGAVGGFDECDAQPLGPVSGP
jgi:hypothetical protein